MSLFKYIISIFLVSLIIIGLGFLSEYQKSNMTDAEIQALIEQQAAKAERREGRAERRREFIDNMMTPVWQQDKSNRKRDWWLGWGFVLLVSCGWMALAYKLLHLHADPHRG